ncbi:sensor histidine kinase [Streptomyces armeniacus]|uniref:sensor histidine kinase n=1 Tax=Streptomyces armeniacus TaxID=83291 RepID=UPI001AD80EB4|nr:nitrate- and nitrite sensing domain-containing protein [Streptomyces armeniacus]
MRTNRLRKSGKPAATTASPTPRTPRRARVRNRLLISVALTAVCVAAAGAPAVLSASGSLADAQDRVDQAVLDQRIIALTHSLADEREDLVVYAAAGRERGTGGTGGTEVGTGSTAGSPTGVSASQRARLKRQIAAVRGSDEVPADLKERLARLPGKRQQDGAGQAAALATYESYTDTIQRLQAVTRDGGSSGTAALPHLGRAVAQASGTRGLLHGALEAAGSQPELTAAAELARVREQGAQEDFEQTADSGPRETFEKAVTGSDVNAAHRYLRRLTERTSPGPADWSNVDGERVAAALSARVGLMRGVHSSLAAAEVRRLEGLRDDEVTDAELRAALVGGSLLLALATGVQSARSLARPLAVVRRGARRLAADPVGEEPVRFTGRNDEFADVVRALNQLRDTAAALHERTADGAASVGSAAASVGSAAAGADGADSAGTGGAGTEPHTPPLGAPAVSAPEVARLRAGHAALAQETAAAPQPSQADSPVALLGQRTLGLIERLLANIEALEADETDPGRLGTLFTLDHLATRTRRHSEGLLLLAGAVRPVPHHDGPVPLLDVLRAAVSETEQYERVRLAPLPPQAYVTEHAADDVSHLVAELLDNATAFSAPESEAQLTGWLLQNGEIMLSVQDQGTGMTGERLAELNELLSAPVPPEPVRPGVDAGGSAGLGLHVAARLAARHGLRVQLRRQTRGGIAAAVILPLEVLAEAGPEAGAAAPDDGAARAAAAPAAAGAPGSLPGSVAEANSNALPVRRRRTATVPHPPALERNVTPPIPVPAPAPDAPQHESADDAGREGTRGDDAVRSDAAPDDSVRSDTVRSDAAPEGDTVREHTGTVPDVTGTGLPRRTPKQGKHAAPAGPPPQRKGGADPEELRRRLGGLQRGAQKGRRDAAAEIAAERGANEEESLP